jgi:hypothetical protein
MGREDTGTVLAPLRLATVVSGCCVLDPGRLLAVFDVFPRCFFRLFGALSFEESSEPEGADAPLGPPM